MGRAQRKIANDNPIAVQRYDHVKWRQLITKGIQEKTRAGVQQKDIAAKTGLSAQTISKLVHGETVFPRHNIVVVVMLYLGYKLYAEK